jgi:hypothetical protein
VRARRVDVVDEHTAVCAAVEGDAERLEALLAGGVPELCAGSSGAETQEAQSSYLHGHETVVDHDLLSQAGDHELRRHNAIDSGRTSQHQLSPCID